MKKRNVLFREVANLLCWFRIMVGIWLMSVNHALGWALLYSLAYISDAWGEWCYWYVPKCQRPNHWFNHLPISMDLLSDGVLVVGGMVYVTEIRLVGVVAVLLTVAIVIVWQIIGYTRPDRFFSVAMMVLTYFWFAVMVIVLMLVWRCSIETSAWLRGMGVTLIVSSICRFMTTKVEIRMIHRGRQDE